MPVPVHNRARILLSLCALALLLAAQEPKRITVFGPQGVFQVGVRERTEGEYVALLDILQHVGTASGKATGKSFVVRYAGTEANFSGGKSKAKVGAKTIDMGAPAVIDQGALLVPVRGLVPLLSHLLQQPADLRAAQRRLILVAPTTFQAELSANPSRLVLHFTKPVSPNIASEPGRLRLSFDNDPVEAPAATQAYTDKLITGATYSEEAGDAVLTVTGSAPLMVTFSDDGRTMTIGAAPQLSAHKTEPAPPAAKGTQPANTPAQAQPATPAGAQAQQRFLVVIDPAHGGDDVGAVLATGIEEKNVTLALARRLKAVLESAGVPVLLLRDGDVNLSADQRAAAANGAPADIYISIHAGSVGRGVRTYIARMKTSPATTSGMLPWDTAQAKFVDSSRGLAASIDAQLGHASFAHAEEAAQLQPLPHIASPAVSVEFLPGDGGVASLMSAGYQQKACAAVAEGILETRRVLEAQK